MIGAISASALASIGAIVTIVNALITARKAKAVIEKGEVIVEEAKHVVTIAQETKTETTEKFQKIDKDIGEVKHSVNGTTLALDKVIATQARTIADLTKGSEKAAAVTTAEDAEKKFEDHKARVDANGVEQAQAIVDAQDAKDEKKE